jgi:aspartate/methionine/tyrosine aminotransferase
LFNAKTKLIIINTPHNPLGKVFDYEELNMIADLAKKHNVLVISDEVYEWLVYEPTKHIRIGSLIFPIFYSLNSILNNINKYEIYVIIFFFMF